MVVVSYSGKEINAKLVYYGPGLSGKTTNLEFIYDSVPSTHRGKMVSMKTRTERTLFFDFLPVDLGEMGGFKTRFLLYTVPGQVYYNATRKLVLRGVDAIVFVADSARGKMNENIESLENLRENLREYGMDLDQIPWVLQWNKRDLPETYSAEELNQALNPHGVPAFEAVATNGTGVFETFKGISKLLLEKLSKEIKTTPSKVSEIAAGGIPAAATPAAAAPKAPAAAPRPMTATPMPPPPVAARTPISTGSMPRPAGIPTPSAAPTAPAAPVAASAGAPMAGVPVTSVTAEILPLHGTELPPEKPSFTSRLAAFFGLKRQPKATEAVGGHFSSEPPMAAPPMPRPTATLQLHKVEVQGEQVLAGSPIVEKRVRVPVPIRLTPEEARAGVTLKLVVELEVVAEGEMRTSGAA